MSFHHPEHPIEHLLRERILVLDGAMGTMVQTFKLKESDYRGERFADHHIDLLNNNEMLSLTRPDVIRAIHDGFLDAGADIIETNTFNAQAISQRDYGLESLVRELNLAAAKLAREAVDRKTAETPDRPRFVAGAIGPTSSTLSISPKFDDPGYRSVTFDQVADAYAEQARALVEGGVDVILIETVFDTLNAKAAIYGVEEVFEETGKRLPIMLSVTIVDKSGRNLSGQSAEAFWYSVEHCNPLSVGINCALGAEDMRPYIEELATKATCAVSVYPNAGLPNPMSDTGYDDTPESMAAVLGDFASNGWLNVVGGCCGTTPAHIRAIGDAVTQHAPHVPKERDERPRFAGLEPYVITPESNLAMVGERTNVTGSPKFSKFVKAGDLEGAVAIAQQQVENGAHLVDVNMDEGMIDSEAYMVRYLNLIASEPDIARAPIMVDSSNWSVIRAGLRCIQGKPVVNSVSLKEGEEPFLAQAREARRFGAAVVVMAFDESGQADTKDRKVAICKRAYDLLVNEAGFQPNDIIFDPNILTVGTGIEEHNEYAVAFIEATREIKHACPGTLVSGGVSNISFSFRGNNPVREAMHAAFLYHAIQAGLDMAIVNAGMLQVYEEIDPPLLERVEDVLLNRRPDATERLIDFAEGLKGQQERGETQKLAWREEPLEQRLAHSLIRGIADFVDEDIAEAIEKYNKPLDIIEGPLMDGMNIIGDLFGAGKMFLPQVVKSARVMKSAVAILTPLMEAEKAEADRGSNGRILLATVKGDVHDIGKNIVGVVLSCNSFDVTDMGVMVKCEDILAKAREIDAHIIGLSGLITPSLEEMIHVAKEMERQGFTCPLLIGGATTSKIHTAVKIAPHYSGPVVHVLDASRAAGVASQLIDPRLRAPFMEKLDAEYEALRQQHERSRQAIKLLAYDEAVAKRPAFEWQAENVPQPEFTGVRVFDDYPLEEIAAYIDWSPFFHAWQLKGVYPKILDSPKYGEKARELFDDGRRLLDQIVAGQWMRARGACAFWPASRVGDSVEVYGDGGDALATFHFLRQQTPRSHGKPQLCLADYIAPRDSGVRDWLGGFVVTAGEGLDEVCAKYEAANDDYNAIMVKSLADRCAEAFAELMHKKARDFWGYGQAEGLSNDDLIAEKYRGIRPAPGYPACPDHTEKQTLFRLLDAEKNTGVYLTESCAMHPASSVSGFYFSHPQSRYFDVGPIGRDQVEAYAARRGMPVGEVETWLKPILAYEPETQPAIAT